MSSGREAALTSLTACRRLDAWSDGSLKAASRGLDRREAALAARLTYGVLQNRALLDFYLGHYCSQSFGKLEPFVRDVLRLGAYQVLFMDRVPDSAAVNEAVKMVKDRRRQRAAGFVNAVLRRLSREKGRLRPAVWRCGIAIRCGLSSVCSDCWAGRRRRPSCGWTMRASPPPSSETRCGVPHRS